MANLVVLLEAHLDGKQCAPTSMVTLNWRDLISSTWEDANYKRTAIASLIQAVYFLELDRQENRTQEDAHAPNYWTPFKYKLTQTLADERDGSIFGAIFEWDRSAALAELSPFRPSGAPRAVLALRGTLLRSPTMRRDIEDDLRFVAWESLKGSARYKATMDVLKSVCKTHGSSNVCIAGHSLGAGFGLQVGQELAKERIIVEAHLFNPPAVSLAVSLENFGEMAEYVWRRVKSMLPSGSEAQVSNDDDKTYCMKLMRLIAQLSGLMDEYFRTSKCKWVPHLYVNSNDWISFFYMHSDGTRENITDMRNMGHTDEQNAAKLFVAHKENQKFLEAHGLKQWWSSDAELQQDVNNCKLISRQLRSLNTGTLSQVILFYYPYYISLAMSDINIRQMTVFCLEYIKSLPPYSISLVMSVINIRQMIDFVWNVLKSVPHLSAKAQISNDVVEGLKGWIPQLSCMNSAVYWVCKFVPYLYVCKNDRTGDTVKKLFVVSKEQQKFLAAHGLEQWWPSEKELLAIHNCQLISRQVRSLYTTPWEVTEILNPSSGALAMSFSNIGEREEFVWKWNSLKSMLHSSSEAQVSNDVDKASGVCFKGWMPQLSSMKDAAYWVCKQIPYMYVTKNDGAGETLIEKENMGPPNGLINAKLFVVSKEQQKFLAAHGLEQWWPSHAELQQAFHNCKIMQFRSSYTSTPWEVTEILNPSSGALAMSFSKIGEREEFVWKWRRLKSMLPSSLEEQVSNDGDNTSGLSMKSWTPSLSGLKDAGFAAGKWVPHMYSNCGDYMSRQLGSLYSLTPSQVSHLFNLPYVLPSMSLGSTGEKANIVCNRLASMYSSSGEAQASNDADNTSGVSFKSWVPHFSSLKDACFWMGKFVPYLYVNKSDGEGEKMVDKENMGP